MPQLLKPGHELICGTIGMGKSYWVLYRIVNSLIHDRPCCYIDPKGDTYHDLLAFLATTSQGQELWQRRKERIILLNPLSPGGWLVGFNAIAPLERFDHSQPDPLALLANSLVSHIRFQSGFEMAEANRMQNIMAAAIGLLAGAGEGQLTLAELPLLFTPSYGFRGKKRVLETHNPLVRSLLPKARHHGTRTFWEDQWPTWTPNARREWVQSTLGRIFQYLFDERLLMTVCTLENGVLDLRRVVTEGHWLLVNIPYALLSDTISALLGNLLVSRILYAAMQRPLGQKPYRLILDEARFFNSGPLGVILETSRAYNLWLTLVVQSLDQLCRSREGRLDPQLKETAVNLCRYFSIFHNLSDGELFSQMMFPLTGTVPVGVRTSGDWEYLPVAAESDAYARRFQNLRHREMIFYDKLSDDPPQVWRTPQVVMDPVDPAKVQAFEGGHLRATGSPATAIREEIQRRQERVRALFNEDGPRDRALPRASFGGWE